MQAHLTAFIDQLRAAGVRASVSESLDAMAATTNLAMDREALRAGLAATLIKDHADRPTFDDLFDRFFAAPGRERGKSERPQPVGEGVGGGRGEPTGSGGRPEEPPQRDASSPKATQKPRDEAERRRREAQRNDAERREAQRLARRRAVLLTPFETMEPRVVEEAEDLVEELARRLHAHLRRRMTRAARGRVDFRRTIRASLATGGVPIAPAFRHRRPGKIDLIALCDLSHSTATAADFCLALLAPASHFFRRVRLFGYVDRLAEISIEHGHVVPHEPLDLAARSDFGQVLRQLWERCEARLTRNTLVLILGDARNNRLPPRADVLARMRTRARRIVWLNPEAPARWNTGDSVLRAYARHCDAVLAATNLRDLTAALKSQL